MKFIHFYIGIPDIIIQISFKEESTQIKFVLIKHWNSTIQSSKCIKVLLSNITINVQIITERGEAKRIKLHKTNDPILIEKFTEKMLENFDNINVIKNFMVEKKFFLGTTTADN